MIYCEILGSGEENWWTETPKEHFISREKDAAIAYPDGENVFFKMNRYNRIFGPYCTTADGRELYINDCLSRVYPYAINP